MPIDTPTPIGTILTCLLTHQHPWDYFNMSVDTPTPIGTI